MSDLEVVLQEFLAAVEAYEEALRLHNAFYAAVDRGVEAAMGTRQGVFITAAIAIANTADHLRRDIERIRNEAEAMANALQS